MKGRGLNQGCPLSPGLYLLTAEIMANKLRNNTKIKGVKIGNVEYLISQFADNTDLYLNFDQETVTETFAVLTGIKTNTGLRLSYDKTTIYRIGSLANSSAKLITPRKVQWTNESLCALGVDLFNEFDRRELNIVHIINKMKVVASLWYYRNMSLTGKITVINSLMMSLYVYRMQVLPVISDKLVSEIEGEIERFLW